MSEERVRVLLVDDEASLRLPLKRYLENNFGYHVDAVINSQEALQLVEENQGQYDVALIDEVLLVDEKEPPDEADGIQLMQQLKACYPDVEAIIFTGWGRESRQRAIQAGAFRYLEKPFDHDELAMVIRTAAQQVRLRAISREILSEKDPNRVLESILVAACSLALADEAAIVLLDQMSGKLCVHPKTYRAEPQWQKHLKNRNLSREIIENGQIFRVTDASQDEQVNPKVIDAGIYAFLGLSIPGEKGNQGVLYVYSHRKSWFEEWGTVAVLQTLAGQAGLALVNAQAFRQIDAHARYMEALVRTGQGLTQATRLEDQLALAWDFVREQLQVSTFFVALYDNESQTLHFPLVYDEKEPLTIHPKKKGHGWGISGYVIESGQEIIWATSNEKTQQCRRMGIDPIRVGKLCESCIYLPLQVGESTLGVVSIQSYRPHAFPSVLLDAFRALGSQLSVALENVRLFEAEARRRQESETLREAVLALTTTLEQDKVFETILAELQKVVPYDSASVQLLQGNRLEIIGGRGFPDLPKLLGISFPLDGDNPNRDVVRRRGPFIVTDAPSAYKGFTEEPHVQAGIHGWLGVPMLFGDQLIGMIALDKREPGFYTEEHARLAQTFATQAAIAIENARLFSELAEAKEWREALIENAFDAVIAIDQDKKITLFNRQAEEMFGRTTGEMVGQTVARLHADVKKAQEIFDLVDREGAVSSWKVELTHQEGNHIPGLLSAAQIRDSRGVPIGQAGFIRDLRQAHLLEDRLRALIHISQAITETLDLDQVLQLVIESALAAFPTADGGSIHLYDERTDRLHIRANTFGYSQRAVDVSHFQPEEGIAGWVFQHNQPTVVDDAERDPRHKNIMHPEAPAHKSMICVPLRVRERAIGTLSLDNLATTAAFQGEDLGLLSTFADQAAIAIDNARRMQELEQMRRAAEAMSRALAPREALQQIVESAAQVLQADSAAIWSYDEVRDKFIPEELVAIGIPEDELEHFREEEPQPGRTADMVMTRGYVSVTNIASSEYTFLGDSTCELLHIIGVHSFQGIALRLGDEESDPERLGVLYINYNRVRTFGHDDEATLRTFASHAALALKNARLLAQMQRTQEAAGVIAGVTVQEDLNQTLGAIARHTQQILDSDAVTLYAYDETIGQFGGWAAEILQARDSDSVRPADKLTSGSVVWNILHLGDPPYYRLVEDNAIRDELLGGYFIRAEGIQAAIGIQLRVGERKMGVMFVNFRSPHLFTSDEIVTIQLFADQAAVAIRNAQLYTETSRLYKQAQLIADISRETARRLELDAFLQTLFAKLTQVFQEREIQAYLSLATYDDRTASLVLLPYFTKRPF